MERSSDKDYTIPIKGLSAGRHRYDFSVDGSLFEEFGNSDILSASLAVDVELEKEVTLMRIESKIEGSVCVECDRCLDELKLTVDTNARLLVKFITTEESENEDDEIMSLDPAESELDLKQFIYDNVCLALPLQRTHKDGDCNPDMIARLRSAGEDKVAEQNSPFEKLKDLLN